MPDAIRRAITYLTNNAERMKYMEYRLAGLPITTSPVESTQKQISKRIKGTEKFWEDDSLEPLLQLKADEPFRIGSKLSQSVNTRSRDESLGFFRLIPAFSGVSC
jgi:hypothetical protein